MNNQGKAASAVKMDPATLLLLETLKAMLEKSTVAGVAILVCDEDGTVAMHQQVRKDLHEEGSALYIQSSLARAALSWASMTFEPLIVGMANGLRRMRESKAVVEILRKPRAPRAN